MFSSFFLRPLHVAARNGLTVVVQELLAKGASVLAVDENGKFTILFFLLIGTVIYFGLLQYMRKWHPNMYPNLHSRIRNYWLFKAKMPWQMAFRLLLFSTFK